MVKKERKLSKELLKMLEPVQYMDGYHQMRFFEDLDVSKLKSYEKQQIGRRALNSQAKYESAGGEEFRPSEEKQLKRISKKYDLSMSSPQIRKYVLNRGGGAEEVVPIEYNNGDRLEARRYAKEYGALAEKNGRYNRDNGLGDGIKCDNAARRIYARAGLKSLARKVHEDWKTNAERRIYEARNGRRDLSFSILGIIGGLFFLSSNITGNAIGSLSNSSASIIGATLFIIGLSFGYFLLRNKRKKDNNSKGINIGSKKKKF